LWEGEFWEDGCFAQSIGDKVIKDVINKSIKHHKQHGRNPQQLELF